MENTTFTHPLVPGLVEQQCDHNTFCHRVFPVLIHENGESILEDLRRSPQSAYEFLSWAFNATNEFAPLEQERDILLLSDINLTTSPLLGGTLVTISLSPPTQTIGTYLIGLLKRGETIRYFTLENGYAGSTRLCEWEAGTRHLNHGVGSVPTVEAFSVRLEQYLTLGFSF